MEHRQQILRAAAGDPAAREQLFDETVQTVYYLCWKLSGSAARAGEATRRTYARAFSTLGDLRPEISFDRWITAIAVTLCCQTLKKTQPGLFTTNGMELAALERADVVDEACLPPECVSDPLMRAEALRTVRTLPPVQRAAMVLRYAALMKPHQIAKLLDVDEYTVSGRLNCGRLALTAALPCDKPAALLTSLFAAEAAALSMPEALRSSCLQTALNARPEEETAPESAPEDEPDPSREPGFLGMLKRFRLYGGVAAALILALILSLALARTISRRPAQPAAVEEQSADPAPAEEPGGEALPLSAVEEDGAEPSLEEKIRAIRDLYYGFQDAASEYDQISGPARQICYARDGRIDCIRYDSEPSEDGRYSASIYYVDAEPYFIYLLGADGDDRELSLYYWDGALIRWVERDAVIHDTPNESYQRMYDWARAQYDAARCADT